jgi:hypothetical protein
MAGGTRFELPGDLADELIFEGTSVRSLITRGPGFSDAVQIALDVVNTGADVVTVATAAAAMPAFVRRLRSYIRRKQRKDIVRVVFRHDGRETAIELRDDMSDEDAERALLDGITEIRSDADR